MEDSSDPDVEVKFHGSVWDFYKACVKKLLAKFPLTDTTIRNLAFLNLKCRSSVPSSAILQLCKKFLPQASADDIDTILEEFRDFETLPDEQVPAVQDSKCPTKFWTALSKMSSVHDQSELCFANLSKLAKVCLVLPHSNADPERLFSTVKKSEASQRSNLKLETTCNLISCKYNHPNNCYQSADLMTTQFLQKAKRPL